MTGWIILFILLILSIYAILKLNFFKLNLLPKKITLFFYLAKIFASVILFLIYTYFYKSRVTTDIFKYYDDALILHSALKHNFADYLKMLTSINDDEKHLYSYYYKMNFWIKPYDFEIINENKTLIRLNALILLFSHGNYFIHAIIFVFLSFCGQVALFKFIKHHNQGINDYILAFTVFLLPSVIIWTSGILKESLISFSLGFSLYFLTKLLSNTNLKNFLLFTFFMFMLFISKFYVFLLLIPSITSFIISYFIKRKIFIIYFFTCSAFILLFFTSKYFTHYDLPKIVVTKQRNFINLVNSDTNIGSKINIPVLNESFFSFLVNTPNALKNTVLRPTIFEAHNLLSLFCAIENLFLALVILLLILFPQKNKINNLNMLCISFSLLLFTLVGLTTPVLGALVRYKVPAFSLFIYFIINNTNYEKLKKLLKI